MGTTSGNKTLVTETSAADIKTSVQVIDDWDESDRCKTNPIVGQAGIAGGSGTVGATVPRVTLASDDPAVTALQIVDDWDETDRCKVNPIAGQVGIAGGTGTMGATVTRVTLATDDAAVVSLALLDDAVATEGGTATTKGMMQTVDDGTYARNMKGGSDGAVYVNMNNLLPGEDAVNDERAVKIKTLGTGNGSALAQAIDTTGSGITGDPILSSTEVLGYSRVCIEFKNAGGGGGNNIDRLLVFASVSGSNWDPIYDSGTGLAWATTSGGFTVAIESNAYRYIKTEGLCASGSTTVDCYWCGNKG